MKNWTDSGTRSRALKLNVPAALVALTEHCGLVTWGNLSGFSIGVGMHGLVSDVWEACRR